MMSRLDEPVERYFRHAIHDRAAVGHGVRLTMTGRIRVGPWLQFKGVETCDGRSFVWRARVTGGLLVATDRFDRGTGSAEGRLLGRMRLFHSADADTRSAAGRAALEAIWTPLSLLPETGVTWRAESDELIVAYWDVPPVSGAGALAVVAQPKWQRELRVSAGACCFRGGARARAATR